MPLQATSGAASYDGFGGGAAAVPNFIEDVFSCFLYTGNGSTQTITNNIDLSTNGGLVWLKGRSVAYYNYLFDTIRGTGNSIYSNLQIAQVASATTLTAFGSTGFSIGSESDINENATTYVSWTFREQSKFFDVVTYTGTGSNTTIAHSLGAVPGCIMVKRTDTGGSPWAVYHRSLANTQYLVLNSTAAAATGATWWNSTTPTSSVFSVGTDATVNASGGTYVAYIFAHNAGGFGLTGSENVISCGSYTGVTYPNSLEVTLGYEPQFVIIKNSNTVSGWTMWDIMRGMAVVPAANTAQALLLEPNTSAADSNQPGIFPTATGFVVKNGLTSISSPSDKMIYIAIRRGPMKVPTDATKVFSPNLAAAQGQLTTGFPVDLGMWNYRTGYAENTVVNDRLRGVSSTNSVTNLNNLVTATNGAELASQGTQNWNNTGLYAVSGGAVFYSFRRAPSFFDEVCYTGTGSAQNLAHNLAVVPELMIVKRRTSGTGDFWFVYSASTGNTIYLSLNTTSAVEIFSGIWNDTTPTSTQFTIGYYISQSAAPYVAYLFATCAGVSKVGSYTGTAATLQIDCGFTGGARWVMIKRTNSTGDWYVWDTARGIVSGNDPYLLLNSTAAEVTNTDYIDTYSAGFEISSTAPAAINANGGTFIFLAIA